MQRNEKKKWWLAIALVIAIFSFGFRHEIFRYSAESYLGVIFPTKGGWSFSYDQIGWRDQKLTFYGISLETKVGSCEIQIPRVDISIRNSSVKMLVSEPLILLDQNKGKESFSLLSLVEDFLYKWKVDINKGSGIFINEKNEKIEAYFSWFSSQKNASLGKLVVSSSSDEMDYSDLALEFYTYPHEKVMDMCFVEADLSWLNLLAKYFGDLPSFLPEPKKGQIDGRSLVGFYDNQVISQIDAALVVHDVLAFNQDKHIETSMKDLQIEINYPKGKQTEELKKRFSIRNCEIRSYIHSGFVHYKDPEEENEYAICDLCGPINFSLLKDSEIDLQGYLDQKGIFSPIVLRGFPNILNPNTLDLDLKLFLDEKQENITKLSVGVTASEDRAYGIKVAIEDLSKEQIGVIQHVVGLGFNPINDFHIREGTISVEVGAFIEKGELCHLFIEKLEAQDLQIYWKSLDVLTFFQKCDLKADFDMRQKDPFSSPDMNINIHKADVALARRGKSSLNVRDIDLDVSVQKGKFLPSTLTADVLGAWTEIVVKGPFQEADIAISSHMKADWIASLISGHPVFSLVEDVVTSVELKREEGFWAVLGHTLLRDHENLDEQISFGCALQDGIFDTKGKSWLTIYQNSVLDGWLSAKHLSQDTMNFFLNCFSLGAKITGDIAFEAEFNKEALYVKIDPDNLRFSAPKLDLFLEKEAELFYDFSDLELRGIVPIERSRLEIALYDLKLQEISADVHFQGKMLDFQHLSIESEGVQLLGQARAVFDPEGLESLLIQAEHIESTSLQLQKLMAHFGEDWQFPFDGRIESMPRKVVFSCRKEDEKWFFDWDVACRLSHATLFLHNDLRLEDFGFEFSYNSQDQAIQFFDITGRFDDLYQLYGKELFINSHQMFCDLRLQSEMMDIIRLKADGRFDQEWNIVVDEEKSHFLNEPIKNGKCTLTNDLKISSLQFSLDLLMQEVGFKLGSLSKTLQDKSALLEGRVRLNFLQTQNDLDIQLIGKDIQIGKYPFKESFLHVKKEGNVFKVDRAAFDDLVILFDATKGSESFSIADLKVYYPGLELFVEKGEFFPSLEKLHLPISKMQIDVEKFSTMKGIFDVQGEIEYKDFHLSGLVEVNSENILKTIDPMLFSYNIDQGLLIEKGSVCCLNRDDCFVRLQNAKILDKEHFDIELLEIRALNETLQAYLPEWISSRFPFSWKGYMESYVSIHVDGANFTVSG
ncbi:MAG: hypothetical protein FJZ56_05610, partial [Chlamydiae bacterium]|nr:hypothetical protein [Chlamydiota bacterium]